ncbi:hypothetical protein GQ44DRAFT_784352 [Phaeosphaeriaceae sp. PMI808]|nr:hypothetical protein GQ44DRAFT_784352 [Phaeosphaeriaceae sp. PMI808]
MVTIQARTKAEDVQGQAGHPFNQWRQFQSITRDEARRSLAGHIWGNLMDSEQETFLANFNTKLREKQIPEVTLDILRWRMAKLTSRGGANQASLSYETSMSIESMSRDPPPSDLYPGDAAPRDLPFDPVKEAAQTQSHGQN